MVIVGKTYEGKNITVDMAMVTAVEERDQGGYVRYAGDSIALDEPSYADLVEAFNQSR